MIEEKAVTASQAFNYNKLMVLICKEAVAGNQWLVYLKAMISSTMCNAVQIIL